MNRLAVYSYLTRYAFWHPGSGMPFTEPLSEKEPSSQEAGGRRQEAARRQAGRTPFPGSDVGLDTARVR